MKTKDTALMTSFQEYSEITGEQKETALLSFRKRIYVDDLNAYLRAHSQTPIDIGIGGLYSKTMIVLEEKDEEIIAFYRDWMLLKGIKISDCYVTFLRKSSDAPLDVQETVLRKEVELFSKNSIIINHTSLKLDGYVKNINPSDFRRMLEASDKELTEDEKSEIKRIKQEYWINVREILNYRIL